MDSLQEKSQRILIVDDNPKNIQFIGTVLRDSGFLISIAQSGNQALEIIHQNPPDLILLDIMMPGIDGIETCRRLKANSATEHIPVIFLSALSETEVKVQGFCVGAVDYVSKPVQKEELLARINTHLEIRRYREHLEKEVHKRTSQLEAQANELRQINIQLSKEIFDREKVESALKNSEKKFKAIFDYASDGILIASVGEKEFLLANNTICKMLGYKCEEIMEMGVKDIHPKEDLPYVIEQFEKQEKREITIALDIPVKRKDGSVFYADINSSYLTVDDKKYLIGMFRDITAQKDSEAKRKSLQEELQRNYDIKRVINSLLTLTFKTKSLDTILEDALKIVTSIDWLAKPMGSIFIAEGKDTLVMKAQIGFNNAHISCCSKLKFGQCLCGETALTEETQFVSHVDDKHIIHYEDMCSHGHYCTPIKANGKILGVINIYLDEGHKYEQREVDFLNSFADVLAGIIMRLRAEEAIFENEEKMRSVLQASKDGIISIDNEGNIILWNHGAKSIFGYTNEEINGESLLKIIPERYIKEHINEFQKNTVLHDYFATGKTFELTGLTKEGRELPVELSIGGWKSQGEIYFTCILRDITQRKESENALKRSIATLRKNLGATINAMSRAVEVKDAYTAGHQQRVAELARAIAVEMGLSEDCVDSVGLAGSIHDLGKLSVPAEILSKPSKINEFEYGLIKQHSQVGYDILEGIEFPWPIAKMILQHHEKIDGSGYPFGLKCNDILVESKIICIADVVEAIASHRPYRAARGIDAAMDEITKNKGVLYDSEAVDACIKVIREKKYIL